jgi:hypothetical protein
MPWDSLFNTIEHRGTHPRVAKIANPQALARDVQNIAEEVQLRRPFSGWVIRLASLAGRLCLSYGMELGLHAPFEYAMVLW